MKGYKGFGKDFKCKDFQYEIGKGYTHTGKIKLCESGFHFCKNPLDIFAYYPAGQSRFAEIEAEDVSNEEGDDSKKVAKKIKVGFEMNIKSIVEAGIKFIFEKVNFSDKNIATGDNAGSQATGYKAGSQATGYKAGSQATGNYAMSSVNGSGAKSSISNTENIKSKNAVAIGIGVDNIAAAPLGCWIVLSECKEDNFGNWQIKKIKTAKVDGKKIKADTWYSLKNGKFVEVK